MALNDGNTDIQDDAGYQPSDRMQIFNAIEAGRVAEINAELEESGSADRIDGTPTPEIEGRASGKNADDSGNAGATDDAAIEAEEQRAKDRADAAAAAALEKAGKNDSTIYEFLGEERLDKTKVRIKVDGQDAEVSISDMVRGHQKASAADKRLAEAAQTRREAEQVLADAKAEAERIRQDAQTNRNSSAADDDLGTGKEKQGSPSGKDAILAATELIYEGNQDEAATILDREIQRRVDEARGSSAIADPAELTAKIKHEMTWDAELSTFNRERKDIATDPELARMFQRRLNEEAAIANTTPREAIERATGSVDEWLDKVSGRAAGDKGGTGRNLRVDRDALRQRQEDKAKTDSVRSNSSIRSQSRTEPEEVYDASKVVDEMRAGRM